MTKIETIWFELEQDNSFYSGLLYKRYAADVKPNVFIALKSPERLRCLAFRVSLDIVIDIDKLNRLKDIKVETLQDERDSSSKFLLVLLLNKQHKDIFSTLCEDLIYGVADVESEEPLVNNLIERLTKWQSLFEKVGNQGLSDQEQRGLYGEIYFLRLFLKHNKNVNHCLKSWLGPENSIQDFQHSNWAVEVKTTHGNNHQKIQISNERQLDDSTIEKLFLFHLSLDVRVDNGETLNIIICEVFDLLKSNTRAINHFRLKLLESGYYDIHNRLYNKKGYLIRQKNVYHVFGEFPRITEKEIPVGVGDVRYSIIISESEKWRIDEQTLFNQLNE